jgi:hypothetical protein
LKKINANTVFQGVSRQGILDELQPLFQAEKRFFPRMNRNGDDDTVKNFEGTLEQIQMTIRNGIKRPWIDRQLVHNLLLLRSPAHFSQFQQGSSLS